MAQDSIQLKIKTAIDTAEASKGVADLRRSIKELKGLAMETSETNSAAFQQITAAIGAANDRMADLNAVIKSQSGEPIENLRNSILGMGSSLKSLDFKSFKQQFGAMGSSIKDLTSGFTGGYNMVGNFKKALAATGSPIKAATSSFWSLAKSIIATGLGALAIALVLVITNIEKLSEAGGFLGKVFTAIGDTVSYVMDLLEQLSDWMKLTDIKNQERSKNAIKAAQKEREHITSRYDAEIKKAAAAGKSVDELNKKKNAALAYSINQEIMQYENLKKSKGRLNEDEQKELAALYKSRNDLVLENQIIDIEAEKEKTDKAKEQANKRKENQDQHKKEVQTLNDKYNLDEKEKLAKSFDDDIKKLNAKNKKEAALIEEIRKDKKAALEKYDKDVKDKEDKAAKEKEDKMINEMTKFEDLQEKYGLKSSEITDKYNKISETYTKLSTEKKLDLLEKQLEKEEKIKEKNKETDKEIAEAGFKALEDKGQKQIDFLDANYKKMGLKEQEYRDLRIKLEKDVEDKAKETAKARLDMVFQIIGEARKVMGALNDFYTQQREQLLQLERSDIQTRLDMTTSQIETQKQQELEKFDMINGVEERVVTEQQARAIRRKYIEDKYNYDVALAKYKADKEMNEAENRVALAAFRRRKALGIVGAIIDGASAIAKIWADVPKADFGVSTIILTAASIANTAAQIATIASANFTPTSFAGSPPKAPVLPSFTVGGGAGGGGGMNAPSTIGLGQANLVPLASQSNWQKVYVVESDIRSTTNKVEVIENRSVLGA